MLVAVSQGGESDLASLISVFWIGVLIFISIRLIRISLGIPLSRAVIFFITTALISLIIAEGLDVMFGLTPHLSGQA